MKRALAVPALVLALIALIPVASASAAGTWLNPVDLGPSSSSQSPLLGYQDVAAAPDGTVVAATAPGPDGGVFGDNAMMVQIRPPGGTFSAPQRLSSTLPGHNVSAAPALAVDEKGNFVAVWGELNGANIIIRAALKPAGSDSFGPPMDISGTGQNASTPDVAIAGNTAIAVWARSNGVNTIVQQAVKPAGSSFFGSAGDLSAAGANASAPKVEMSPSGAAIAGWQRLNGSSQPTVQAAFRPAGGSFGALPDVFTNTTTEGHIDGPQVAIAPDGRATIAWASYNGNVGVERHTLFAAARGLSGSFGGLDTVSDPAVDSGSGGSFDLAVDQSNTAVLVWNAGVIRASTRPSGGSFSDNLQPLSQPSGNGNPAVAFTPDGGAIAVWQGTSGSNSALQAAEMPPGGQFGAVTDIATGDTASGFFIIGPTPVGVDAQGNAATVFAEQFDADPGPGFAFRYRYRAAGYDAGAPSLRDVSVPDKGVVGKALSMSAVASDVWSGATVEWGFGDGTTGTGGSVSHTYATPGTKTVTVTATDSLGNTTSQTREIVVEPEAIAIVIGDPKAVKKPKVKLGVTVPKQSWEAIQKAKAIVVQCVLDAAGTCKAAASVTLSTAKGLGLKVGKRAKSARVGGGTTKVRRANRATNLKVKLTRKALAAIAAASGNVKVSLAVTGSASGYSPTTLNRKLTIRP